MGQEIKPHMLWVSRRDHAGLHTQCSNCRILAVRKTKEGENRGSNQSLAQRLGARNHEVGAQRKEVNRSEFRLEKPDPDGRVFVLDSPTGGIPGGLGEGLQRPAAAEELLRAAAVSRAARHDWLHPSNLHANGITRRARAGALGLSALILGQASAFYDRHR